MKVIAKKIVDESLEILKTAKEQIAPPKPEAPNVPIPDRNIATISNQPSQPSETTEKKDLRFVQALEREMEDIRKERERKKLEEEKEQPPVKSITPVETSSAKKGRRFSFGKKTQAKRQQTRVERILPPSG